MDKVFISHLHVDHYGDLASFWLGGTVMNRLTPLRVWGPSGATPEYGTKYALEKMQEMYVWDVGTRAGFVDFRGGQLEVNENGCRCSIFASLGNFPLPGQVPNPFQARHLKKRSLRKFRSCSIDPNQPRF